MITTTTITLNDKVKKAAQSKLKDNGIRGGFSAYIEELIKKDLKRDGIEINDK